MATSSNAAAGPQPKLLRATYLAASEGLLRETRGTALFYLPGPILALLVLSVLDYSAAAVRYTGLAPFPGVTAFMAAFPTIATYTAGQYLLLFFLALTILALLWLLVRYLRWIRTVYAVTTHRVIIQRGILSRDFEEIPIPQVRGVDVHMSIFQRMMGYGSVKVSSESGSSTIGNEEWKGIPHPFEFQRLVEAANQAITRGATPPPGWNQNPPTRGPY
jgi:membrane protein YdbS with pleckstrin-like domain